MAKGEVKRLRRELHERGLRKRVARELARAVARPATGAEPPERVREAAEALRRLAADLEAGGSDEHAEPQASARQAAHPPPSAPSPRADVRPRARRT